MSEDTLEYDYKLIEVDEFDNNYVFVKDYFLINLQKLIRMYIRHTIVFPNNWRNKPTYYNEFIKNTESYLKQNPRFANVFKLQKFLNSMDNNIMNIINYLSRNLKKVQFDYDIFPPPKKIFCCITKPVNYNKLCPECSGKNRKIQRFIYEGEFYLKMMPCEHIICESPCYTNILASKRIEFDHKKYPLTIINFKDHVPIQCIICKTKLRKALYRSDTLFNYYLAEIVNEYTLRTNYS